ncbi:MAG: hypothetical protein ACPGC9_00585 [Cytophagales bacterium]
MIHFRRRHKALLCGLMLIFSCQSIAGTSQDETITQETLVELIKTKDQQFNKHIKDNCNQKFLNKKYGNKQTLMHLLAAHDTTGKRTQFLLETVKNKNVKLKVNAKAEENYHCLHTAVQNDNLAFIQQMQRYQEQQRESKSIMTLLSVKVKNQEGKTPFQMANELKGQNQTEIMDILTIMGKPKKKSKSLPSKSKSPKKDSKIITTENIDLNEPDDKDEHTQQELQPDKSRFSKESSPLESQSSNGKNGGHHHDRQSTDDSVFIQTLKTPASAKISHIEETTGPETIPEPATFNFKRFLLAAVVLYIMYQLCQPFLITLNL